MFEKLSLSKLLFLLFCFGNLRSILGAVTVNNQDGPYDPIKISIPMNIWKQAFKPTPVLKSAATIVLPIHVNNDDYDDEPENDEEATENEVSNDEVVVEETPVLNSTPATLTDSAVALAGTHSNSPAEEDLPAATNDAAVPGQVFRFPCACVEGQCGCCTGSLLQTINMKACSNISFVPEDFVFDVRLSVNNNTMVRRRVSASDPPPICFNPRRAPFVRVCAEISNIRIRNNNAYACMDITADIGGFNVYSASFRCFGLGASGVQTGLKPKPVSSGPAPVNLFGNNNRGEDNNAPGLLGGFADGVLGGGGGNNGGGLFGGSGIFGGNGPFGGGGGSDADDDGPFGAIGDAFDGLGDFLDAK